MAKEREQIEKRWITFKDFAEENISQRRWPDTESSIRSLYSAAREKGLLGAFRKVGRRCLISPEELYRLIDERG
jgi:hypothetical protein